MIRSFPTNMCPYGNKLETFPLPNDPDSETITADQQGSAKPDFTFRFESGALLAVPTTVGKMRAFL